MPLYILGMFDEYCCILYCCIPIVVHGVHFSTRQVSVAPCRRGCSKPSQHQCHGAVIKSRLSLKFPKQRVLILAPCRHTSPATKNSATFSPSEPWPNPMVCGGPCWPLLRSQHPAHIWGQNPHPLAPRPELSGWGRLPVVSSVVRQGPAHLVSFVRPRGWLCKGITVGSTGVNTDTKTEMMRQGHL